MRRCKCFAAKKQVFFSVALFFGGASAATAENYDIGQAIYFDPYAGKVCAAGDSWSPANPQNDCIRWHVIKDNGNTVEMIADHDFGRRVSWAQKSDFVAAGGSEEEYGTAGDNRFGPLTVLKELKKVTSAFQNVEVLTAADNATRQTAVGSEYTINYEGFKARLLGAREAADLVNDKNTEDGGKWNSGTASYIHAMPKWLYANLGMPAGSNHVAFYTDTAHTSRPETVWVICLGSNLGKGTVSTVGRFGREVLGIRPIVRVKKSILESEQE